MSENPRDTQFAGFAAALGAEIADTDGWDLAAVERLIARRAYDLAQHVLYCNSIDTEYWNRASNTYKEEIVASLTGIPDLTELPKEQCNEK